MPAMQPGSGGPYSEQKQLRYEINWRESDLEAKPMSPRKRKEVEEELAELKARLKDLNAVIRQSKSTKTSR